MAERLYRSRDDRMLAGVAGGVAEMLDADPSIVRIAWALLAILTGGIALVVYIVMAIVVPEAGRWGARRTGPPGCTGRRCGTASPARGSVATDPQSAPGACRATGREAAGVPRACPAGEAARRRCVAAGSSPAWS